jgi:hypothetical protein
VQQALYRSNRIGYRLGQETAMNARICTLALALGFALPAAYAADPVYKSTMPNGRVVYGESPQPGAKRVDKVAAPPEVAGIIVADDAAKARAAQIEAPAGPRVSVLPEQKRESPQAASQGLRYNPTDKLPSRSY